MIEIIFALDYNESLIFPIINGAYIPPFFLEGWPACSSDHFLSDADFCW
jgi:hypothetical protein